MGVERKPCGHEERDEEAGSQAPRKVAPAQWRTDPPREGVRDTRSSRRYWVGEAFGRPLFAWHRHCEILLARERPRGFEDQISDLPPSIRGEVIESQAANFPMFIRPGDETDGLHTVAVGGK